MKIYKQLLSQKLPKIYKRDNSDCYFDTYRKKLIEITPEERVRQRVASLFETEYGVPHDMIALEAPMSHYVDGASGRADIIIHAIAEDGTSIYPVAIIECKNEDVPLTDKVIEQAVKYCDIVLGKYIVATNGVDLSIAAYDGHTDKYVFLDKILSYEEMLGDSYVLPEIKKIELERLSLEDLSNQDLLSAYNESGPWIYGAGTPDELKSFSVNLFQCFLDTEHLLPRHSNANFELTEDIGVRYMDYSNAGGGHYTGDYRSFLVKDRFGESQIVSFSCFGTDASFRDENRNSYTSLVVSVDSFKTSHNSLQYNIDRFVVLDGNVLTFIHNGQIGNHKNKEVIDAVSMHGVGVRAAEKKIDLGCVHIDKLLYMDDPEVANLMYNFIEYALIREEVRKAKR